MDRVDWLPIPWWVFYLLLALPINGAVGLVLDLNKTLSSLEIERTALLRIPTWPWEPGTIRGLAAAVFLPIAIWLAQFWLERWMK